MRELPFWQVLARRTTLDGTRRSEALPDVTGAVAIESVRDGASPRRGRRSIVVAEKDVRR